MDLGARRFRARVEDGLWPLLETLLEQQDLAGLGVAVVHEDEVVSRGFGVRDVGTRAPVTPETMFHLASVSKPFVATAIVSLSTASATDHADPRAADPAIVDLDAPIIDWVPEFTLADGRAAEVTARNLLSHTSGLPDVTEYGWHAPRLGDDALSEFARSLAGWRLQSEPGSTYSYSNAGFELLGLLLSRAMGTTFEDAIRALVLAPLGMQASTFRRSEVPEHLAAAPHVAMPLAVPEGAYPYTRQHAPSSSLHSNLVEMSRWLLANLEPADATAGPDTRQRRLDAALLDLMWRPVVDVGQPPWEESAALGWAVGSYGGHRVVSHSGLDPGFQSRLVLVPERRTGVVVLANSNTIPASSISKAALDIALADVSLAAISTVQPGALGEGLAALPRLLRPIAGPVAETLTTSGEEAARATYRRLAALQPAAFDLDDDGFVDAVWGAIELHRTAMVWPLLRLWTDLRPDSSPAWTMTGWAHQVDGDVELARGRLGRALDLDPDNDEAAQLLNALPPA